LSKIYIVGVNEGGPDSLTASARQIIEGAEILAAGKRLLTMWPDLGVERLVIGANMDETMDRIAARRDQRVVILASGDPGFFGIAKRVVARFGRDQVEIIPNVASVQLAFARIKENWDDAVFVSAHGRPMEDILPAVRSGRKIAILTDDTNSPARIASLLLDKGLAGFKAYVCENIGRADERITESNVETLAGMEFAPLNVLILIGTEDGQIQDWPLGIPDGEFNRQESQRGLITKREVRVLSLCALQLTENSTVWDIGAGTGSVAIEAARLAKRGHVYAVEKNHERVETIKANVKKFAAYNVTPIEGRGEDLLAALPDPDAVFIGGSGGSIDRILAGAGRRLKPGGRIVLNMVTLENLHGALEGLKRMNFQAEITLVNIAKSADILNMTRFEPLDPVFIVTARRKDTSE
jgi:precorrin-6B C5,15-methyltransferase / cobalt-precorrin-6B C5,C15-methyltransferase